MEIETTSDFESCSRRAAELIVAAAERAVGERGRFTLALSGGRSPWRMLEILESLPMPWADTRIFQVDERVAPDGDADRNHTRMEALLRGPMDEHGGELHPMPVTSADLDAAAEQYAATLAGAAGSPAVLDLVHLGLGEDGHTASLVPGDPVLAVADRDVALTGDYQGRRRMTFTYPLINRARARLFVATGAAKREMVARAVSHDPAIPAGWVVAGNTLMLADREAMGEDA